MNTSSSLAHALPCLRAVFVGLAWLCIVELQRLLFLTRAAPTAWVSACEGWVVSVLTHHGPTEATAELEARGTWRVTKRRALCLASEQCLQRSRCLRVTKLHLPQVAVLHLPPAARKELVLSLLQVSVRCPE